MQIQDTESTSLQRQPLKAQGLDETVLMLQGFAQPPAVVVQAPRRGLTLLFVGTAGMLLILIFRFWCGPFQPACSQGIPCIRIMNLIVIIETAVLRLSI